MNWVWRQHGSKGGGSFYWELLLSGALPAWPSGGWRLPALSTQLRDTADGPPSPLKKRIQEQVFLVYTCSPVTGVETIIKFFRTLLCTSEVQSTSVHSCFLKNYTTRTITPKIKDVCERETQGQRQRRRQRETEDSVKTIGKGNQISRQAVSLLW